MAKTRKGEVNKSEAIRDYLAANKGAKATAIVAALAEKGITFAPPLVYAIIKKNGGGRKGRKAKTTKVPKTTRGTKTIPGLNGDGRFSLDTLLAAKKLSDALGGVDQAKAALDVLAKLA